MTVKVFIAGYDVIGKNMAGPGIRSLEIARYLSSEFDVTLSIDSNSDPDSIPKSINVVRDSDIKWESSDYFRQYDSAILPGSQSLKCTLPDEFPIPLIVDIYDPYVLENLEMLVSKPASIRDFEYLRHLKALLEMLMLGDRFLVTSPRAADLFTGMLVAWGVINPVSAQEISIDKLILDVPFGIPDEKIENHSNSLPGDLTGKSGEKDTVILWAGGLWDWLDPISLVESMPDILTKYPDAKLIFPGYKHPNPHVPVMKMATDCIDKAKKLKLFGDRIIFREWTPYDERIPLLRRASIGVSLHNQHLETRFSFRTRLMDYIWASIPMVLSTGDYLSEELIRKNVAKAVENSHRENVSSAIIAMLQTLDNPESVKYYKTSFANLQAKYRWSSLLKPLADDLKSVKKINDKFYRGSFRKMLESYPVLSEPRLIDKAIEKIKKGLR